MQPRYANMHDVPRIVGLAREEHAMSKWAELPFNEAHTREVAEQFITLIGRTLLVTPGGYIAGLVQPLGFSPARGAIEYAWYANDGSGLALLHAFEDWAKAMHASSVVVHDYVGDGRLGTVLGERHGYQWMGSALFRFLET